MRTQLVLILIITVLLLSACGKKGPVRPITKAAVEQPAATPEADSKESEEQSN
jgi:predicted small lipoprotein YifL